MIKTRLLILILSAFPMLLMAQDRTVSGTVTDDETGEGVPGANVVVKNTAIGTVTDLDGRYALSVPQDANTLVFSFIGYGTQEISVGQRSTIDVGLVPEIGQLKEVVVTAIGIERETKSLAYAQQSVNTTALDEARSSNFLDALSGRAAGVQVVNSGTPTGTNRVVIRGITSVTGNNQPLYVVDGVPLDNPQGDQDVSVWNGGSQGGDIDYGSPIAHINPDDIGSIEILKGANAAALYGSRAGNGVVLITTKRGKKTKGVGVSVNSNTAFTSNREYPYYQYKYGTGASGRTVRNANHLDDELGIPILPGNSTRSYGMPMLGQDVIDYNGEVAPHLPRTNNIKELYQTGVTLTNSVSLDKAYENGSFRLSYTNLTSDFTIENFEEQVRHNLSLRNNHKIMDNLTADVSLLYTNDRVDNRLYQNGSNRNPANSYMYLQSDMYSGNLNPYKDENGNAFAYVGPFHNPYWFLNEQSNQDKSNHIIGNITLNYEFLPGFTLRGRILGDVNSITGYEFNNMGASVDADGFYRTFDRNRFNWNYEGMLRYDNTFMEKLSVNALVGVNRFDLTRIDRDIRVPTLLQPNVLSLSNSSGLPNNVERDYTKRINSVFGSASFGWDGTLFVDVTARNDWSSTLPDDNNSYFYPSVGGSLVLSELFDIPAISFSKIRVSYAEVGNDTDPYNVLTGYSFGGFYDGTAWLSRQNQRRNPDLKPELTSSWEYGFEAKFLNNRLSLNATYYKSSTINQIIPAQTSPTSGYTTQIFNAGEIQNEGWEIFLSGTPVDRNGFRWDIDANWSTNESLVVSLIDGVDRLQLRQWFNVNVWAEVGKPLGEMTGTVAARDPESGIRLVRNNGRIIGDDDEYLGNAQPDWLAGVRNSFSYKGFTFNFLIDVKMGGDVYSGTMLKALNFGMRAETLDGREDWYFSDMILGENNNERRGVGLYGTDYVDADRPKGNIYENVAFGVQDDNGNWVAQRDENGEIVMAQSWMNPQLKYFDPINRQEDITYDASYVKLRELVFGYNIPNKWLNKTPFTNARVAVTGRNLWNLHDNMPQGIDPEANTTSGNGQGIEYATFLPMRTWAFNIKFGL